MKIPRMLKHQGHGFKLVLLRQIPRREVAAIYVGPLVLNRGKLEQSYLVMGLSRETWKELDCCSDLKQALQALCLHQSRLHILSSRSTSKPPARVNL